MEWLARNTDQMTRKWPTGPGDGGPCPICGQDMAATVYEERLPTVSEDRLVFEVSRCSGRYWHMKNAHATMEDYLPPRFPTDSAGH